MDLPKTLGGILNVTQSWCAGETDGVIINWYRLNFKRVAECASEVRVKPSLG